MENPRKIPWWRTSLGKEEIFRLIDSISKEHISQGPVIGELEGDLAKSLGVPYAVVTTSGSVALLLAAMVLDIGPGDEVIVPNRTWIATAHAPMMLGAKVVLVDVLPDIPAMDVSQIKKKITKKTKAIMPVHLNGRADDMDEINAIAKEYGLYVMEDAAQALFSRNANGYLGTQSDLGCFSFSVAKLITTGQGGFVVTKNKDLYEKLVLVRNHGLINNFHPTFFRLGCNFRFTDLMASIGIEQLKRAPRRIAHVTKIYKMYEEGLRGLPFISMIPVNVDAGEVPIYIEVISKERDKIMEYLDARNIEVRPFLPNVHEAPYIDSERDFPHSEVFSREGMTLPCGPDQPLENIERTVEAVRNFRL